VSRGQAGKRGSATRSRATDGARRGRSAGVGSRGGRQAASPSALRRRTVLFQVGRPSARRPLGDGRGLPQLVEVAPDAVLLGDEGEELHASFARRALEDVDPERSLQELGPRPVAGPGLRQSLGFGGLRLPHRLAARRHPRPPRTRRREDPGVLPHELGALLVVRAVEEEGVQVRVQAEVRRSPLHDRHRSGLGAGRAGALRVEAVHRLDEDPRERAEQLAVAGELPPPRKREGQPTGAGRPRAGRAR
jgi:hypothetical protein